MISLPILLVLLALAVPLLNKTFSPLLLVLLALAVPPLPMSCQKGHAPWQVMWAGHLHFYCVLRINSPKNYTYKAYILIDKEKYAWFPHILPLLVVVHTDMVQTNVGQKLVKVTFYESLQVFFV
jgi:hypothetical protein